MADHTPPEAIFTISFPNPAIVNHVHNERFVTLTPTPPKKKARVHRDTTPSLADAVLTIRPDQVESAQGIYFGSDTKQCDVFLAPQKQGVSSLHFRVTFKFEQSQPKDFLVRNLSTTLHGTTVDKKKLVGSAMAGFRKNIRHTIIAGSVILFLTYHPDNITPESWQKLQRLSTDPPSLNIVRIGSSTRTPIVTFDPQSILARVAKFEQVPAVAHVLPWSSNQEYTFLDVIARTNRSGINTLRRDSDNKVFAVKMMINGPRQTERWSSEEQFERELHILKDLDHPNIVKLVDFCKWPGSLLLVMEYAEHGSLQSYLATMGENATLEAGIARTVMTHIWRGLNYLHSKDISHGDLTPENVLLLELNPLHCIISDFGEARQGEHQTCVATLCYMAPEVVKTLHRRDGFEYKSKPADIWSSGVIAYRLLTGQLPPMPTRTFNLQSKLLHWQPDFEKMDPLCRSLMKSILSVDPSDRLTAESCLDHDWHVDFLSLPSTPLLGEWSCDSHLRVSRGGVDEVQENDDSHPDFSLMPSPNCSLAPTMTSEEFEEFEDQRFSL